MTLFRPRQTISSDSPRSTATPTVPAVPPSMPAGDDPRQGGRGRGSILSRDMRPVDAVPFIGPTRLVHAGVRNQAEYGLGSGVALFLRGRPPIPTTTPPATSVASALQHGLSRPPDGVVINRRGGVPSTDTTARVTTPAMPARELPRPFPGFVLALRGGVVAASTTPVPPPIIMIRQEGQKPQEGAAFIALRGPGLADPWIPVRFVAPEWRARDAGGVIQSPVVDVLISTIPRGTPPAFAQAESPRPYAGVASAARGGVPTVGTTPPQPPPWNVVANLREREHFHGGHVLSALGGVASASLVAPSIPNVAVRQESPRPWTSDVLVGRGGPAAVSIVPSVTRPSLARAEDRHIPRGGSAWFRAARPSVVPPIVNFYFDVDQRIDLSFDVRQTIELAMDVDVLIDVAFDVSGGST